MAKVDTSVEDMLEIKRLVGVMEHQASDRGFARKMVRIYNQRRTITQRMIEVMRQIEAEVKAEQTPQPTFVPCSEGQRQFVRDLCVDTGTDVPDFDKLGKAEASTLIDELRAKRNEQRRAAREQAEVVVDNTVLAREDVPAKQRYALGTVEDPKLFYIGEVKGQDRVRVARLIGSPGGYRRDWLDADEATRIMDGIAAMGEVDSMLFFGEMAKTCGACGAALSDPESLERRMGPQCARNRGLR